MTQSIKQHDFKPGDIVEIANNGEEYIDFYTFDTTTKQEFGYSSMFLTLNHSDKHTFLFVEEIIYEDEGKKKLLVFYSLKLKKATLVSYSHCISEYGFKFKKL